MDAIELKPGVHWVGAIDWAIRDFHGYITPKGSTYNNYLIMDDEVTLVDAVKHDFVDVSIARIRGLTDMGNIKHVVVNHIEPDHASGLAEIMRLIPGASIYCTRKGRDGLGRFFDISGWDVRVVKTGDELKIGRRTLLFIETPMIHWPDSMMTYVKEDRLLISQDGFGQHLASTQRFDDEFVECASSAELEDAVWDYYANILMPFGTVIRRTIEEIGKLGLEIDMIAPDHGVIWRSGPGRVLQMYLDMAGGKTDERVVIIYDSMWHNTEKMTQPIMEGIKETGMDCRVMKLRATPTSVAVKEFWRARGCLVGSPTLNNTIFPKIAEFLYYLKGLRPKNRVLGAFGSYGWAGGAVKEILELSKAMKLETVEPGFQFNYKAGSEDEEKAHAFGREFALRVREYHRQFQ
ncbi:MAG: FprA family A-type flavoprotein [Thermodesulfovibrionales bacterium]